MSWRDWNVRDPNPNQELHAIDRVSSRARSLLARNRTSPILASSGTIGILGAIEMLEGLEYHHDNFARLASELASGDGDPESRYIDHEAVAYINRMGQFYYFAESDYMKASTRTSQVTIPTIRKYMIFRNKFTAHRSLDAPRRETEDEKIAHARAVTSMLGSLFTPIPNIEQNDYRTYDDQEKLTRDIWSTNYRTYQTYDPSVGHVNFTVQIEHPAIMGECYELISRVLV